MCNNSPKSGKQQKRNGIQRSRAFAVRFSNLHGPARHDFIGRPKTCSFSTIRAVLSLLICRRRPNSKLLPTIPIAGGRRATAPHSIRSRPLALCRGLACYDSGSHSLNISVQASHGAAKTGFGPEGRRDRNAGGNRGGRAIAGVHSTRLGRRHWHVRKLFVSGTGRSRV